MFTFKTPEADLFLNSLKVGWEFVIRCNQQWEKAYSTIEKTPHTNPWKKQDAVLTQAKENLCKLEDRILTNVKENIKDQCGDNKYYYCWSALDLGDKSSVEERITKLKDLLGILCTEKVHVVKKYTSKKMDQVAPYLSNGYLISYFFRIIVSCISLKISLKIEIFSIITASVKLLLKAIF